DILVVDDNQMNLNVMKGLLKATKVFVTTSESGEDALNKIKDHRFNVVLLDHMMPGMDGIETVAEIRKIYPDLPVYALTANSTAGEEFYKSKGFNGYLSKPVEPEILEKTIMKHLPEEMMEKPTQADAVEEITEIPEDMKWIYETEGVSAEDGIKASGGVANYIYALKLFLDTIDDNSRVIKDAYDSGNIRLYTIKVHALKSSARIIGAPVLSKLAEQLEDAGNHDNMNFINDNTDRLLSMYEDFKEKLKLLKEEEKKADNLPPIPEDELKDAYSALADVIPQMDYDAVEMILASLHEYKLPDEDENKMAELEKMLKTFDWDGMEQLMGLNS
ncbi:MAG: response regulator, partial [Lachnospiraceae bacterium]|nr:response regulator [Lachnospiraceae bacterium]